jgi:tripeptide aminopeptidase
VRAPSEAERRRLHELFCELCAIESPSGSEDACAQRVRAVLHRAGLTAEADTAGNLLARIPGRSDRSILLCAHMDTVPNAGPIEPVEVDGGWENARDDILGADNKAALAVMLLAAARCAVEGSPVGIELLFTVREELALAGAKEFDASRLRSEWGYVYDHASPIGQIVMASPTYFRVEAAFHGRAAHAGIRPEDGRSAVLAAARAIASLRIGRLDSETTASVSGIEGGSMAATNVVPEHARFLAEARSLDDAKVDAVVAEMVDRIHDAANDPVCDVDADISVQRLFQGYRHGPGAPSVAAAEAALRECGYAPAPIVTGGASDANALEATGFTATNLANGTERNHEPTERVSFAALEGMLEVTFALLEACAAVGPVKDRLQR